MVQIEKIIFKDVNFLKNSLKNSNIDAPYYLFIFQKPKVLYILPT